MLFSDFDSDGRLDIVVSDFLNPASILYNDGGLTFKKVVSLTATWTRKHALDLSRAADVLEGIGPQQHRGCDPPLGDRAGTPVPALGRPEISAQVLQEPRDVGRDWGTPFFRESSGNRPVSGPL